MTSALRVVKVLAWNCTDIRYGLGLIVHVVNKPLPIKLIVFRLLTRLG